MIFFTKTAFRGKIIKQLSKQPASPEKSGVSVSAEVGGKNGTEDPAKRAIKI
jgi:hypothetical protein